MEYFWQQIHQLIVNALKPEQLLTGNAKGNTSLWQQADEVMKTMPHNLIIQVCRASGKKERKALIHSCQAGGAYLLNQLHTHSSAILAQSQNDSRRKEILLGYQKIKNQVWDILDLLQNQFPKQFNQHQPLPNCRFGEQQHFLQKQIDKITRAWQDKIDAALLELTLQPARDFIRPKTGPNPSYAEGKYLYALFDRIDRLTVLSPPDAGTAFLYILINCNFNHNTFIEYAVGIFQQKIAGEEDHFEKIIKYQQLIQYLVRLHPWSGKALYPRQPGCLQTLTGIFKQELYLLEKQFKHLQTLPPNRMETLSSAMLELKTNLSGAQLALCLRLFNDSKILQCTPEIQLFKLVAKNVQPPRGKPYSYGTLKTKYHEPDRAAINILKDYLIKMINLLNTYTY